MERTQQYPDWTRIDTVLLDLDGTLLDLAFDNHFWLEQIPATYAQRHGLTLAHARAALHARFAAREGTLEWYCVEFWSRELGLDIVALKRASAERIAWLPGARECLSALRAGGKRLVLLTNAHPHVLDIKHERTGVRALMHAVFSSHRFGVPKESAHFWRAVRELEPFDTERTVVDDSPAVLRAARRAGVRWVFGISRPDTGASRRSHDVPAFDSVADLFAEACGPKRAGSVAAAR